MSSVSREQFLINSTRSQISNAIQDDIDGSESLMKEVFEKCDGDRDLQIVYTEMRAIITRVKKGRTA